MARLFSVILFFCFSASASVPLVNDFVSLVGEICKSPCGVDALRDQKEREEINSWLARYDKEPLEKKSLVKKDIHLWMMKDKARPTPVFTPEKQGFVEARFREKKSDLRWLFDVKTH